MIEDTEDVECVSTEMDLRMFAYCGSRERSLDRSSPTSPKPDAPLERSFQPGTVPSSSSCNRSLADPRRWTKIR